MISLAILGDIHHAFDARDVDYFNASSYDLLLLVGDLSDYSPAKGYRLAGQISQVAKPSLLIPGNHDTVNLFQLLAEIKRAPILTFLFGIGQRRRVERLRRALRPVQLCGYSQHPFSINGNAFDIIAARPFSMGGPDLSFTRYLKQSYRVNSMASSADLLRKRIDEAHSDTLFFLAHNGPTGLGDKRTDIWGCDFRDEEGDYGDPDLELAIEYALGKGKRVPAVIAGHMHHALKGSGSRVWRVERQGTLYINAARVPRIQQGEGKTMRHHIQLTLNGSSAEATEVWV